MITTENVFMWNISALVRELVFRMKNGLHKVCLCIGPLVQSSLQINVGFYLILFWGSKELPTSEELANILVLKDKDVDPGSW